MLQRLFWLGGAVLLPLLFLTLWLHQFQPLQAQTIPTAVSNTILIDAVLYDGYEYGDADEAVGLAQHWRSGCRFDWLVHQ